MSEQESEEVYIRRDRDYDSPTNVKVYVIQRKEGEPKEVTVVNPNLNHPGKMLLQAQVEIRRECPATDCGAVVELDTDGDLKVGTLACYCIRVDGCLNGFPQDDLDLPAELSDQVTELA